MASGTEIVERIPVRSVARRGAAIDLVLDRSRENRSQIVFTKGRGRDMVFWQSARARKQARPNVSVPSTRAAGISVLRIIVDSHERYAYRFTDQQVQVSTAPLPCGDHGLELDGRLAAAVERKSLPDLVSSLTNGRLRFALGELAALPRAAVVVEERYSQLLKVDRVRPAVVLDGLAELQVRYSNVPIVFCETGRWRRSGRTGTSRPPGCGPSRRRPRWSGSRGPTTIRQRTIRSVFPGVGGRPRRSQRSSAGHGTTGFRFRTVAGSALKSGTPGTAR